MESLPQSCATPEIKLDTTEGEQFELVEALRQKGEFPSAVSINDLDGVRVDYVDGFGLARPSNTTPTVVMRFEGDTVAALARIEEDFRNAFRRIAPHVRLPF
ncbi:Phosphomannomutase/phosphoglucomutase [compost metagenome]